MPKKKKTDKPPPNLQPEFSLAKDDPRLVKQRKKKKNAPDRPQPAWMFPPDEENPVLNPRPKSEQTRVKEEKDRDASIKFLHYKSVTAPMKPCPPGLLLTLVGAFLSSYGFHGASRLYTTQLKARKKLDDWAVNIDEKLPGDLPDLVKIFNEWSKEHREQKVVDETSSSSDDSEGTSDSGSEEGDSDVNKKDAVAISKSNKKSASKKKAKSPSPSSSSSPDSDADDEEEGTAGVKLTVQQNLPKPTVNGLVNKLKRKPSSSASSNFNENAKPTSPLPPAKKTKTEVTKSAAITPSGTAVQEIKTRITEAAGASSSSSPSDSSSDSSSDSGSTPSKAAASTSNQTKGKISTSTSTSSDSDSDSSSDTSDSNPTPKPSATIDFSQPPAPTPTTESTLQTNTNIAPSDSSSTLLPSSSPQKPAPPTLPPLEPTNEAKAKLILEHNSHKPYSNTPFRRVPPPNDDTPLLSNKYKPYEYADRAHQDLSRVKGKGFTKEKNKKKRGSYKGGTIDVEGGGRGMKFED